MLDAATAYGDACFWREYSLLRRSVTLLWHKHLTNLLHIIIVRGAAQIVLVNGVAVCYGGED